MEDKRRRAQDRRMSCGSLRTLTLGGGDNVGLYQYNAIKDDCNHNKYKHINVLTF